MIFACRDDTNDLEVCETQAVLVAATRVYIESESEALAH